MVSMTESWVVDLDPPDPYFKTFGCKIADNYCE
jgi:hypothetical protein